METKGKAAQKDSNEKKAEEDEPPDDVINHNGYAEKVEDFKYEGRLFSDDIGSSEDKKTNKRKFLSESQPESDNPTNENESEGGVYSEEDIYDSGYNKEDEEEKRPKRGVSI